MPCKSTLTALGAFFISLTLSAQTNSGSIKGKLQDSISKKVLSLATVTVFRAADTALITYRLSDQNGDFKVPSLPINTRCRVLISFQGYKIYRKEFELTSANPLFDLGTLSMVNDPRLLDEVFVTAERPPVSIRKDTIEFNASAFKSLPSALVEDLLKKLPGIEIDPSGNIMVKGKQVNRLLVDGKEFFGGDPKIATRNLPANIVDKVQVMDDKEQIDKNPDISPADVGQVVNIKLKRSIKQGWFGKAYAGGGTDKRYETGAIVNAFRDTTQISILGYSNNINKAGFGVTDLQKIGGFERSGVNEMAVYSDGGVSINGTSFGGTGQGLQQASGAGFNFNQQFKKKVTFNLQYFYGQVNSNFESLSNRQRFLGDTVQVVRSSSVNSNTSLNHRIGGAVVWKVDTLTTITFRPGITLSENKGYRNSNTVISDNFRGDLNAEVNRQNSKGNGSNYSHNVFVNKLFKKKGRFLTINNNVSVNEFINDQYFDLVNTFYVDPVTINSNQLRQRETSSSTSSLNILFTEPLSKTTGVKIGHTADYTNEENIFRPYNKNSTTNKYNDLIDSIHTGLERSYWRNTTTAGFNWRKKKLGISSSINLLSLNYQNNYLKSSSLRQNFSYIYPAINIDISNIRISYSSSVRPPSAYDLQPVVDNTNRQFLQYGNPDLKPTFSRNISFNFYKYKPAGDSYSLYANASRSDNAVIRENSIDKSGIQSSKPLNVNGLNSLYGSFSYTKQWKFINNYRLSLRPSVYTNYNESVVIFNGNRSGYKGIYYNAALNLGFNFKDKIELNQRYSFNINQSRYDIQQFYKNLQVITHSAESEVIIRLPKKFVWENLVNYSYNPQVSPGIRKNSVRWNAAVNYLFLKEDKGQFKLSVFDLLNQNINVYRGTNENSIYDSQVTTLRRYFMVSFIYNIRTFSPGKVGGKDRGFFLF